MLCPSKWAREDEIFADDVVKLFLMSGSGGTILRHILWCPRRLWEILRGGRMESMPGRAAPACLGPSLPLPGPFCGEALYMHVWLYENPVEIGEIIKAVNMYACKHVIVLYMKT